MSATIAQPLSSAPKYDDIVPTSEGAAGFTTELREKARTMSPSDLADAIQRQDEIFRENLPVAASFTHTAQQSADASIARSLAKTRIEVALAHLEGMDLSGLTPSQIAGVLRTVGDKSTDGLQRSPLLPITGILAITNYNNLLHALVTLKAERQKIDDGDEYKRDVEYGRHLNALLGALWLNGEKDHAACLQRESGIEARPIGAKQVISAGLRYGSDGNPIQQPVVKTTFGAVSIKLTEKMSKHQRWADNIRRLGGDSNMIVRDEDAARRGAYLRALAYRFGLVKTYSKA